jgi:hypothetical protein
MNFELTQSIQAGYLPVGILPVPADVPDPTEADRPGSDDACIEVKDFEATNRLWPRVFPGL